MSNNRPLTIEEAENRMWKNTFTEADLLRLVGQLEAAEAQGFVLRRHYPCEVFEHRHKWRLGAWLCGMVRRIV